MAYSKKEMEGTYKSDYEKINGMTQPTFTELGDADYSNTAGTIYNNVDKDWHSQSTLAFASNVKQLTTALNKIPLTITALQAKCKVLFQYRDELFDLDSNISMYNYYVERYNQLEAELAQQQAEETEGEN